MSALPLKADFPILAREINGHPLSYLDNAASTQKPRAVIDAIVRYYEHHNANVHRGVHTLSEEATSLYEQARETVARFIGAPSPRQVVFTGGTTGALNLVAQGWARPRLKPGDEILLTEMEHHSNLVPWQMAARERGAVLRYIRVTPEGLLDREDFSTGLARGPKLVALTYVSNVLGTVNPVAELTAEAHRAGAVVVVDAAQAAPKGLVDVSSLDCDFLAFSGHKVYGPTGIGVLYGREALLEQMEPASGGGGMITLVEPEASLWAGPPARFEAGTPNVAGAVGLATALDYLGSLEPEELREAERTLTGYALQALAEIPQVRVYGPLDRQPRAGVISFNLDGAHPHDVAEVLDGTGVAVRGGHHCCQVLMRRMKVQATVRASLALYNDRSDVDRLAAGVQQARSLFCV